MNETKKALLNTLSILAKHPLVLQNKITEGDIRSWIVNTFKVDPERLAWHAKRSFKIGGSEIFTAVAFYRAVKSNSQGEHYSAFTMQSVQEMVAGKLLKSFPVEPDQHMRRGILSEPLARAVYVDKLRKLGRKVEFDKEASNALQRFVSQSHPWLAYNDDDVLIIDGKRTLIDYKCPAPDPINGLDLLVEEAYEHQLHLGHHCLEQVGFPCEELKLVKYNVVMAEVVEIPVQIKPEKVIENLDAGTYVYENYILKNRLPEYQPQFLVSKTLGDIKAAIEQKLSHVTGASDAAVDSFLSTVNKFAMAKAISVASTQQASNLMKEAKSWLKATGVDDPGSVLVAGPVEVKLTKDVVLDEQAIMVEAERLGIDMSAHVEKVSYNLNSILTEIKNHVPSFQGSMEVDSTSIVMTRKQKGVTADIKNMIVSGAEQSVSSMLSVVDQSLPQLKSMDDAVAFYVKAQESKRAYFMSQWENAITAFNDYSVSGGQEKDSILEEFLAENATQVTNQPF